MNALAFAVVMLLSQTRDGGTPATLGPEDVMRRASDSCWASTKSRWISGDSIVLLARRTRRMMSVRETDNPLPKGIPWWCFSKRQPEDEPELRDGVAKATFFAVLVDDDLGVVRLNRIEGRRVITEHFAQHDATGRTVRLADLSKELPRFGMPEELVPILLHSVAVK